MAYVPGWKRVSDLIRRLEQLEVEAGSGRVIPARWEPFYEVCPCARDGAAYVWARSQIRPPLGFAVALAFFPEDETKASAPVERANWLLLRAHGEASNVTRKLIMTEALETWVNHASPWLHHVVTLCANQGFQILLGDLVQAVQSALEHLQMVVFACDQTGTVPISATATRSSHAFDVALLQMDGWAKDPGTVILPVDGLTHSLVNHTLLLDLHKITLLKGRKPARSVAWEKVTLVSLFDGAIHFAIADEPPLTVAGFRHPDEKFETVQYCFKAATERILQALAAASQANR